MHGTPCSQSLSKNLGLFFHQGVIQACGKWHGDAIFVCGADCWAESTQSGQGATLYAEVNTLMCLRQLIDMKDGRKGKHVLRFHGAKQMEIQQSNLTECSSHKDFCTSQIASMWNKLTHLKKCSLFLHFLLKFLKLIKSTQSQSRSNNHQFSIGRGPPKNKFQSLQKEVSSHSIVTCFWGNLPYHLVVSTFKLQVFLQHACAWPLERRWWWWWRWLWPAGSSTQRMAIWELRKQFKCKFYIRVSRLHSMVVSVVVFWCPKQKYWIIHVWTKKSKCLLRDSGSSDSDESDSLEGSSEVGLRLVNLESYHGNGCDKSIYSANGGSSRRIERLLANPPCACKCVMPLKILQKVCKTFWNLPKSSQDSVLWSIQSGGARKKKWFIEGQEQKNMFWNQV